MFGYQVERILKNMSIFDGKETVNKENCFHSIFIYICHYSETEMGDISLEASKVTLYLKVVTKR